MGIRSRREVRNHPSKKIPLPPSSPCSLILDVIETGILWAIVRVWRCVAVTRWVYEKRGNERGESCCWVSVLFFLIATGGSLYTILYSNHIKKFNNRQAAYVVSSKRPTFLRTCVYAAVVYISAFDPVKKRREAWIELYN